MHAALHFSPIPSWPTPQVKEYRRYVMREVMHHGGLKHPFIIDLKVRACAMGNKGSKRGGGGGAGGWGCCGPCSAPAEDRAHGVAALTLLLLQEVLLTPEYLAIVMEYAQGGNVRGPCASGQRSPAVNRTLWARGACTASH